jgi:hypothetical protein
MVPAARVFSGLLLFAALLVFAPFRVHAQTELISGQPIGMTTRLVFPHVSLPGATGIDFSYMGAFAPTYTAPDSHTVVINFEWGPSALGPWTVSPDYVNTVPGGPTDLFSTGTFRAPADASFVAVHFHAGAIMFTSGEFAHVSAVPEPSAAVLVLAGVCVVLLRIRRRALRSARGARRAVNGLDQADRRSGSRVVVLSNSGMSLEVRLDDDAERVDRLLK